MSRNDSETVILVGVGNDPSGVGYGVKTPQHPRYDQWIVGETAEAHIYTHVREDALDLYGFLSAQEKQFFLTLMTVQGVGPKLALSVLSHADEVSLVQMILSEDKAGLNAISGVGKKTVERMLIDLKDGLQKKVDQGQYLGADRGAIGLPRAPSLGTGAVSAAYQDAHHALMGLGFREPQVKQMLERVAGSGSLGATATAQDWIKSALSLI